MHAAGQVVARTLQRLSEAVVPGVTPKDLDAVASSCIDEAGAKPSFLGYHGFPATICTSVNEVVVHGIPDDRPLQAGDLISIDCGAIVEGWHGDAAVTVLVGGESAAREEDVALVYACRRALSSGIAVLQPGGWLRDIGAAVEDSVRAERAGDGASAGFGIVADYTGHGIGRQMHEPPFVPNLRTRRRGPRLEPGVVLAVEPMITLGSPDVEVLADDWTVRTVDGRRSAHVEHTVAVTPAGPWVLTELGSTEPT